MSLVWVDFKVIGMGGLQGHWYGWTSRSLEMGGLQGYWKWVDFKVIGMGGDGIGL